MSTLDRERAEALYNSRRYSDNTNNWEDDVSEFRAEAFLGALRAAGLQNSVKSIIDVGCGSGGVLVRLAKYFRSTNTNDRLRLKGIDASAHAIEIANRIHGDAVQLGIELSNQSTEDLNPNERFDVVSLIHVLEHCPDMRDTLDLCSSIGDYVYVNVPLEVNLFYTIRRSTLLHQYEQYGHLHFFDEKFFERWVQSNGYHIMAKVYSSDFEINKPSIAYAIIRYLRRTIGKFDVGFATWLLGGYSLGLLLRKSSE